MGIDYLQYAQALHIIPVWQKSAANDTGYHTPESLYQPYTPFNPQVMVLHATVGTNTLPYFADKVDGNWNVLTQAGSIRDGRQVLAHQLIPKDDYTIYDMVPSGHGCGHANPASWLGWGALNFQAYGFELENQQNGVDLFTDAQYVKLALTLAYKMAKHKTPNRMITTHHAAATGHRTDPDGSPFDITYLYWLLYNARQDGRLWGYWGVSPWKG